jgi:Cu/Ag efflux pump CusA
MKRSSIKVVIGGLATSTLFTLLVLPSLYQLIEQRKSLRFNLDKTK